MLIDFDELNYLIYRYLAEQGYEHSAFAFSAEARIPSLNVNPEQVPMGLLVNIMQKALQMIDIEVHLDSKGYLHKCTQPLAFLKPHCCASMNVLNQSIVREPLKVVKIERAERTMHCLDNLPKPVIADPAKSLQQIYHVNLAENVVQQLYKQKLEQDAELKRLQLEEKKQEQVVPNLPDVAQSLVAANYIIERIKLPEIKQDEVAVLQKQIQIHQVPAEVTEQTILQDKPKYRQVKLFHQIAGASISAVATVAATALVAACQCKALICDCKSAEPSKTPSDARLHFVGTEQGQFFALQLDILSQQFQVSRDLLQAVPQKAKVVQIILVAQQSRVIVVQENCLVSEFKISFAGDKMKVALLFSGHPVGQFRTSGARLSPNQELLAVFGHNPTPVIFDLRNRRLVQQAAEDQFDQLVEKDGFGFIDLLHNVHHDKTMANTQARVLDCCFLNDLKLAFIREDNMFQVNEIRLSHQRLVFEIELREFLEDELRSLLLFGQMMLIMCVSQNIYELTIEQTLVQPVRHQCEFQIKQAVLVKDQGVVCLTTQNHIFLFSQFANDQPMIKMDWAIEMSADAALFGWNELAVVTSANQMIKVDVTQEEYSTEQISGTVVAADIGETAGICGFASGVVVMEQRVEVL